MAQDNDAIKILKDLCQRQARGDDMDEYPWPYLTINLMCGRLDRVVENIEREE